MRQPNQPVANARRTKVTGPDGRKVDLASLPLVAFALNCNHVGRDYAVRKRDLVFCEECHATRRVTRILAG